MSERRELTDREKIEAYELAVHQLIGALASIKRVAHAAQGRPDSYPPMEMFETIERIADGRLTSEKERLEPVYRGTVKRAVAVHFWLFWTADLKELVAGYSGDADTALDAMREITDGEMDYRHMRDTCHAEEVDADRWSDVNDWDAMDYAQKEWLRPRLADVTSAAVAP